LTYAWSAGGASGKAAGSDVSGAAPISESAPGSRMSLNSTRPARIASRTNRSRFTTALDLDKDDALDFAVV